jgi:hypothetical protein
VRRKDGGHGPRGWKTERGPCPALADLGLREHASADYPPRTKENVRNSDGTVVFAPRLSPGCDLTVRLCRDAKKPYLVVVKFQEVTADEVVSFIKRHKIKTLNVAGNRESVCPGIEMETRKTIVKVLTTINNNHAQ